MSIYDRLEHYYTHNRPAFVLFTEFIGFFGMMTAILGIGYLREWLS